MHRSVSVKSSWIRGLCGLICALALAAIFGLIVGHSLASAERGAGRALQNPFEHSRIGQ